MTEDQARPVRIADANAAHAEVLREIIEPSPHDLVIRPELTEERGFGWVVHLIPRKYLQTGDRRFLVPGIGPIVVTRDGDVVPLSTSLPPARAVSVFEQTWDATDKPHH